MFQPLFGPSIVALCIIMTDVTRCFTFMLLYYTYGLLFAFETEKRREIAYNIKNKN